MSQEQWASVDQYFNSLFVPSDTVLETALESTRAANMPLINVAPNQGKLLHILARMFKAQNILELGTLAGYSTIWLGRALPPDGRLVSLELNQAYADLARANIDRAGLSNQVEVRVGPAIDNLPKLDDEGLVFDLVFIDADKASTPKYLDWALRLTKPGSVIIIDNVVRDGGVVNAGSEDANIQGIRTALAALSDNPRLVTTALQTVGGKGYDGFAIALVTA